MKTTAGTPVGGVPPSTTSTSLTVSAPTAKERRVRFMQETKSQSLDTPYHHSHEQQKLSVDMDSDAMTERSHSFTAITQCHQNKGKHILHFVLPIFIIFLVVLTYAYLCLVISKYLASKAGIAL